MMLGWRGQLLRVNLSSGTIRKEPLERDATRAYLGGRGLGTRLQSAASGAETNLAFMTGPLTGSLAPNGGRYTLIAGGSNGGAMAASIAGNWGAELKFAGYDGLIFEGSASELSYLWITDGAAELRGATHLRGKTVAETTELIRLETDEAAQVSCVGPAGENGVSFAVVVSDYASAAGAAGIGALMGRKNLKAVAVRGRQGFPVAQPAKFLELGTELRRKLAAAPITLQGSVLYDTVLMADAAATDDRAPAAIPARPRGCLGCASAFSSLVDGPAGNEVLRLSGEKQLGWVGERLAQYRCFVDLGLDFLAMKSVLSSLGVKGEDEEIAVARRIAFGQGQRATPAQDAHASSDFVQQNGYSQTERSPCLVGDYAVVPRLDSCFSRKSTKAGEDLASLMAALESAGLCPFAAANMDTETAAALLQAATGIAFSPAEVLRVGARIIEALGTRSGKQPAVHAVSATRG
jgi:aldehyde:ferredoxin oxidoreductase